MKLLRDFVPVQEGAQPDSPDHITVVSYNLLAQKYVDAGGCVLLGLHIAALLHIRHHRCLQAQLL